MLYLFPFAFSVLFFGYHVNAINDFALGLNFCDHELGENTGSALYTDWFSSISDASGAGKAGRSAWASDSNYYDPDCGLITIKGQQCESGPDSLRLGYDIRFCIQAADHLSGPNDAPSQKGDWQCTPWSSEGGGWSDWANDANCYDPDGWRVYIDKQVINDEFVITDIRAGIQFTDGCEKVSKTGPKVYTPWLIQSGEDVVFSDWAGDSNNYDFDSIRIYLGVQEE